MLTYLLPIVGFEIEIMRLVKMNQNRHHVAHAHTSRRPSLASHAQSLGILPSSQSLTEIIDMAEQFEYSHH